MQYQFAPSVFDDIPTNIRGSNRRSGFVFVDEIEIGWLSRLIEIGVTYDLVGRLSIGDILLTRAEIERM